MNLDLIEDLKANGFIGFRSMRELFADSSAIPKVQGVYLVLCLDKSEPEFLVHGTGGYFKGKDPNVSIDELRSNWVKDRLVLYIGKAGGQSGKATLYSRLRQYLSFGQGKPVGHWGGRLIWQLKGSADLILCWKPLPLEEPREVEVKLMSEFVRNYGQRPFANLSN
ncbi:MAG: hypothetical protein WCF84_27040 [Anaerolineae bacterium]